MRFLPALIAAATLSGCASTYKHDVVTTPSAKLERDKPVLIATPKDGSYESKVYRGSGSQTAGAVRSAFSKFTNKTGISATCSDLPCLQNQGRDNYGYFVIPEILHWEDRNTEWSGIPDKVEVKLVIVDARSNYELAAIVISGKSKWATFGGDHPQDLLPEPIKRYVEGLY